MSNTEAAPPSTGVLNTKFLVKHAFGSHVTKLDCIQSFNSTPGEKDNSDRVIFKIGKQVCIHDVESGRQDFFDSRSKAVTDIVHFTLSSNSRFISVCEKVGEVSSHIAIYSLSTLNKLKTLSHSSAKTYICSTFCGDAKLIAALTGDLDRQIIIWMWEKEKFHKSIAINTAVMNINLLRCAPSSNLMLTTSGPGIMKYWSMAQDGTLKPGQFLPPTKESLENFVDHVWLPASAGHYRLIVLSDPDSNNENAKVRKQTLFVFEGSDENPNQNNGLGTTSSSAPSAPINMELRQAIVLKLEQGGRLEKIVPTAKAFMLVGLFGLVCTYERTDDKHEPYVEARRISIGEVSIVGATVPSTEEKIMLVTKNGRILAMALDMSIEQLKLSAGMTDEDGGSLISNDEGSGSMVSMKGGREGVSGITDLTPGGFHCQAVIAADLAYERPLLVTISTDNTARVWNYKTNKCELVHHFRGDDPMAVSVHSSGFQVLVSFKDRIRMYNILMNQLKPCKETILKNCKCLKFSHGSQYFAAASAITIVIYETKSFTQMITYQGHMMTILKLSWAVGDQVLFSAGMDGNIYGWPIAKEGRIDVIAASNRSSTVLDLTVDAPSTSFQLAPKEYEDDAATSGPGGSAVSSSNSGGGMGTASSNALSNSSGSNAGASSKPGAITIPAPVHVERYNLIVASLDGYLRMPSWSMVTNIKVKGASTSRNNTADTMSMVPGDPSVAITAMQLSNDRTRLYCGTSTGSLRVYAWPPPSAGTLNSSSNNAGASVPFYEIFAHSEKVVAIKLTPIDNCVVSAAEDGSIFIHTIVEEQPNAKSHTNTSHTSYDAFDVVDDAITLNNEVVLMSTEDVEDHVNEVVELQKMLNETRAKNDFHARKLESDHNEALKKLIESHDIATNKEKEIFERQRANFDKRLRELIQNAETKETDHIKIITDLENKYEHKLADQLERYDLLHEKMQLLKQKCEGLLEAEKANFQKQLVELNDAAKAREKKLRIDHRRAVDDKQANENAFKEIINQQEDEYEDELRQLIHAAETELVSERDTILKLRTLVQTKKTKIDQLEKKLTELSVASKARMVLLNQERLEKQKLLDTIEHYKKNLIEREDALAEKEKIVLELRSTTRTLENFRFVLDHRLQQLSSERGPITSHIEGLEKHISTMYEELVEEFNAKKVNAEALSFKDQKISWITSDLNKTRESVHEKEQYIAAFKRELGNIVSSMVVGKELEESVKMMYKKFVRGETGVKAFTKANSAVTEKLDSFINAKNDDEHSVLSMDTLGGAGKGGGQTKGEANLVKEVEEALIDTAKEADRQKKFVERQSDNLKHRLACVQREAHTVARHRLNENSTLLYECNELRTEVKDLKRKLDISKNQLDMTERRCESLQAQLDYQAKHGGQSYRPHSSKTQQRLDDAIAAITPSDNMRTAITPPAPMPTANPATAGQWIVHNSLIPKNSTVAVPFAGNNRDAESVHSLHGNGVKTGPLIASQSAPNLETGAASAGGAGTSGRQLGRGGVAQSATQLMTTTGGPNTLTVNMPRAIAMKDGKKGGDGTGAAKKKHLVGSDLKIDILSREVDSLAHQLDDATREREMQRLEISRLRKQVMAMSVNGVPSHNASSLSAFNQNLMSLQLPSISLQHDSVMSSNQHQANTRGLTNADLYGVPSEEDKRDMVLAPAASVMSLTSGSKSRGGMGGVATPTAGPSTVSATSGRNSQKNSARVKSADPVVPDGVEGGKSLNDLHQFSLQSSMSVESPGELKHSDIENGSSEVVE